MACPNGTIVVSKHCREVGPKGSTFVSAEKIAIRVFLESTVDQGLPLRTLSDRRSARQEGPSSSSSSPVVSVSRAATRAVLQQLLWKLETEASSREFVVYAVDRMKKLRRAVTDVHERYNRVIAEANAEVFDPMLLADIDLKRTVFKLL
jgi:hypothetical protein